MKRFLTSCAAISFAIIFDLSVFVATCQASIGENGGSCEFNSICLGLLVLELLFDQVDIFADGTDVVTFFLSDLVLHGRGEVDGGVTTAICLVFGQKSIHRLNR